LLALVNNEFDLAKQVRRVLHFVNDDGRAIVLQKQRGVCLGKRSGIQIVKRDVVSFWLRDAF